MDMTNTWRLFEEQLNQLIEKPHRTTLQVTAALNVGRVIATGNNRERDHYKWVLHHAIRKLTTLAVRDDTDRVYLLGLLRGLEEVLIGSEWVRHTAPKPKLDHSAIIRVHFSDLGLMNSIMFYVPGFPEHHRCMGLSSHWAGATRDNPTIKKDLAQFRDNLLMGFGGKQPPIPSDVVDNAVLELSKEQASMIMGTDEWRTWAKYDINPIDLGTGFTSRLYGFRVRITPVVGVDPASGDSSTGFSVRINKNSWDENWGRSPVMKEKELPSFEESYKRMFPYKWEGAADVKMTNSVPMKEDPVIKSAAEEPSVVNQKWALVVDNGKRHVFNFDKFPLCIESVTIGEVRNWLDEWGPGTSHKLKMDLTTTKVTIEQRNSDGTWKTVKVL